MLYRLRRFRPLMTGLLLLAAAAFHSDAGATTVVEPASSGGPLGTRLITAQQYQNAIANIFGPDIKNKPEFPRLRREDGLVAMGAATAIVSPGVLDSFDLAARNVASQVVDRAHRDVLFPCTPKNAKAPDDACAAAFLQKAGRILFRGKLQPAQLARYVATARSTTEKLGDFYEGIETALSGMLIAPEFVYFIDQAEADPVQPTARRLDALSKATRLSLLLWNSVPDSELLRAAEKGELHAQKGLDQQIARMVLSPQLENGVRAFFADAFMTDAFEELTKDPVIYPVFTPQVALDAKEQMLRMVVDHLVTRKQDYRDLFTTRNIFLTTNLGAIYRLPVQAPTSVDWVPYELPENDPRAGLLTQIAFLAVKAHPGRSSATLRGKGIREIFMCQKVPLPPPNVDFSKLEMAGPDTTARERLDVHMSNPGCSGCHKITDPVGLALEKFDGAGQYREKEGTKDIDTSGNVNGVKFENAKQLGETLRNDTAITSCIVQRLYQYSVGRRLTDGDKAALPYLQARFAEENYDFIALMRAVARGKALYAVGADDLQKSAMAH